MFADDGFSGAALDRPALEALRDAVASGWVETVLVWSVDRLSRNFAHQMLLQEESDRSGVKIVFAQEPDDGTPQGCCCDKCCRSSPSMSGPPDRGAVTAGQDPPRPSRFAEHDHARPLRVSF